MAGRGTSRGNGASRSDGSRDFRLVSVQTGETPPVTWTLTPDAAPEPELAAGGGSFLKVFQEAQGQMLADHPEVTGDACRLLVYLESVVRWGNRIPGPTEVVQRAGWPERSVFRWYAALKAAEFIIHEKGGWYLNPIICWKGAPAQYQAAIHRLIYEPQRRLLVAGRSAEAAALDVALEPQREAKRALAAVAESPVIEGVVIRDGDAPQ